MTTVRPGILAVRAVNQYRSRDILPYLSLRYYLANSLARSDQWARQVATDLVSTRTEFPYFHAHHFKDLTSDGKPVHRRVCLPGANEALAEAALLAECARHPEHLGVPDCVFSYRLAGEKDRSGVFEHYTRGLCLRHEAVAKACDGVPDGVVQYLDIQRFYPTISVATATNAWKRHAQAAGLSLRFVELGCDLIDHHRMVLRPQEEGILTGPMFSHFLGNLVLRDLDATFCATLPAKYFRYVDDIILVGEQGAVTAATKMVEQHLDGLGFRLHPENSPKRMTVPVPTWLKGRADYQQPKHRGSWPNLIGNLKWFLLKKGDRDFLQSVFRADEFRIPIQDYSVASSERTFAERFRELLAQPWFRRKAREISVASLVSDARWLRANCEEAFPKLLEETASSSRFDRKRLLPKLRFLTGRLVYVGSEKFLSAWFPALVAIPELHQQGRVMESIMTGRVEQILALGSNVAQAVAQPLSALGTKVTVHRSVSDPVEEQSLAVLKLNGIDIEVLGSVDHLQNELVQFAHTGSDLSLMRSGDPFMRQLACLHGVAPGPRHPKMLSTAFDQDDVLVLDAIEQLHGSGFS